MTDYIVPLLLLLAACAALRKKENAYDILLGGAAEGLKMLSSILPALVVLLTAVHMLRASGAFEILGKLLGPVFSLFGIPPETAMLVLIRPISGSAALAVVPSCSLRWRLLRPVQSAVRIRSIQHRHSS